MRFVQNDGGRSLAGFKGSTGDCVTRAIAIATGIPYRQVYDAMAHGNATQRKTKHTSRASAGVRTARMGINTTRKWFKDYMHSIGWEWVPTMHIGSGCKVHLVDGELPMGRLIVAVSRHYTAVIDGVIHDLYDPQRKTYWYDDPDRPGTATRVSHRCVYGYWQQKVQRPLVRFSISGTAALALPVDFVMEWFDSPTSDVADKRFDYTMRRAGKGWTCDIECSEEVARYILRDFNERAQPIVRGEGYDQPATWRAASQRAVVAIRAALSTLETGHP